MFLDLMGTTFGSRLPDCLPAWPHHPLTPHQQLIFVRRFLFFFSLMAMGDVVIKWAGTLMRGPHELIDFTFSVHIYLNTNCHRYSVLPLDSGATTNWRSLCEGTDLLPLRYLAHGDVGDACGHEQWPVSDSNVPMSTWMGIGMVVLGTTNCCLISYMYSKACFDQFLLAQCPTADDSMTA